MRDRILCAFTQQRSTIFFLSTFLQFRPPSTQSLVTCHFEDFAITKGCHRTQYIPSRSPLQASASHQYHHCPLPQPKKLSAHQPLYNYFLGTYSDHRKHPAFQPVLLVHDHFQWLDTEYGELTKGLERRLRITLILGIRLQISLLHQYQRPPP